MLRWFPLFFIVFFTFLSGFIPPKINERLFLRNVPSVVMYDRSVAGAKAINKEHVSQIRELEVGAAKDKENSSGKEGEWGKAKQVGVYTWTIKVVQDSKNATAQEIFLALNSYREKHGRGALSWDDKLGEYAKERAHYFTSKTDLDGHAGFTDYINNEDGFRKLGFAKVGENSSYGYILEGIHLIEWVYAGDKPHDDNQLSRDWSYVGIGVDGVATDLIFGGKKP